MLPVVVDAAVRSALLLVVVLLALKALRVRNPHILMAAWQMVLAIPGTTTDPGHPVVRATVAAWEELAGRPHEPSTGNSGATDANILRNRGIPTARVGMPKVSTTELPVDPSADFQMGMNTVDVREMERLTRLLIRVAVELTGTADGR